MGFCRPTAAALLAVLGCSNGQRTAPVVEEWEAGPDPVASIGIAEGEAAYELHRASDAIRMRDGRIIVANSGSSELRVFDSTGAYLRSIGREGGGPGEFRGAIRLFPHAGDSLVVYDSGNGRFSVLDSDGRYARVLEPARRPFPWDDWLFSGTWVSGVRDASLRPCVAAALRAIPIPERPSPPVRRAILDEAGRLWLQPLGTPELTSWRVYSIGGTPLGTVRLPDGFRPYQIGHGFILGARAGEDGAEEVDLYRLTAPAAPDGQGCKLPALPADSVVPPDLGADLRNAVVAQEVHFADHQGYASQADSLQWNSASGAKLTIVAASQGGWAGVLTRPDGGPICAIAVGDETPAGWPEGSPLCATAPAR